MQPREFPPQLNPFSSQESNDSSQPQDHTGSEDLENFPIDDILGIYLKEQGETDLLSHEEEIDLAKKIEKATEAQQELQSLKGSSINTPEPPNENIQRLKQAIEEGKSARQHLIKANTRLVVSIAKKHRGMGIPFLDLTQEGNLGLMRTIEKFDYRRGLRFSTYATWWIRQAITRALADQKRTIRIPIYMTEKIKSLYKHTKQLEQRLGRRPTPEEIAQYMDKDPKRIRWMIEVSQKPISLEQPIGHEEDTEFQDFIEDHEADSPQESAELSSLISNINRALSKLTPREARILRLRNGLIDGYEYTLEEIGDMFGLTRERIRQIEKKALNRLRHPRHARKLRKHL